MNDSKDIALYLKFGKFDFHFGQRSNSSHGNTGKVYTPQKRWFRLKFSIFDLGTRSRSRSLHGTNRRTFQKDICKI